MGGADINQASAVRNRLSRHPIALECVSAAASFVSGRAEVVVLEGDRVYVAASSTVKTAMQPRLITSAEAALTADGEHVWRAQRHGKFVAVPIVDDAGNIVASLSVELDNDAAVELDGLEPLARLAATALATPAGAVSGDLLASVLNGQRDAVIVLCPDLQVRWAGRGVVSLLGRSPAEVVGRSAADFLHPDDVAHTLDAISRIAQGLEMYRVNVRLLTSSGTYIPIEVTGNDLSSDPTVGGMVLSLRDAQYESEMGAAMDRTNRLSGAIVDGLRDGVVATDEFGTVTVINDVAREMFGIDASATTAQLTLDDFALVTTDGRPHDLDDRDTTDTHVCCLVSGRGEVRFITTACEPINDSSGHQMGRVVIFSDVTRERRAADELRTQALHDQLTGLPNRRQLEQRLGELSLLSPGTNVAACFVDLDGFKLVNDNHGHKTGDELVRIAAKRLLAQLRDDDLLVRQGGDEFVALLVGCEDLDDAARTAERCRATLSATYSIGDKRFDLTGSIGVAMASTANLNGDVLLQHADIALYAAKSRGRNRVERFDEALAVVVTTEERQQRILRDALDDDRVVMHFQPLVSAKTQRAVGYEALARVRTVEGDILTPVAFMEAIAGSSLMWELDRQAFSLSCQAAALLSRVAPDEAPYVACNFSSVSVTHPDFLATIDRAIASAGIAPEQICIELTESAAFESQKHSGTLDAVRERGINVALDDFGTGYSSLAHLRDLPLSAVKVDRSFIAKLADDDIERSITEAVVSLAQDLGLSVVAEGVENVEQLGHAQMLGFDTIQGWHYSKAVPLDECLQDWTEEATR